MKKRQKRVSSKSLYRERCYINWGIIRIIRSLDIRESDSETGHEMDYRIPLYPDNERRSRATRVKPIKRFFRTYLCRSREGKDFSPISGTTAFERVSRYRRIHLHLLRDRLPRCTSTFSFFVRGSLYPPLDCSCTRASIDKKNTVCDFHFINSLYSRALESFPSSVNIKISTILSSQKHFFSLIILNLQWTYRCYKATLFILEVGN